MGQKDRLIPFVTLAPRSRDPDFKKIKNGREQMNGPEVKQTAMHVAFFSSLCLNCTSKQIWPWTYRGQPCIRFSGYYVLLDVLDGTLSLSSGYNGFPLLTTFAWGNLYQDFRRAQRLPYEGNFPWFRGRLYLCPRAFALLVPTTNLSRCFH